MPNFCYNEINASKEVLEELYDEENKKITFQKLIPMPEELKDTTADGQGKLKEDLYQYFQGNTKEMERRWNDSTSKIDNLKDYVEKYMEKYSIEDIEKTHNLNIEYGFDNWYDWSIKNWGTKWDAYDGQGSPEEGNLNFGTAWNPPNKVIEKLFKKYPGADIDWYYEETGMNFAGHCHPDEEGNVVDIECEVPNYDNESENDDMEF